jgi:hypothetical protein
MSWGTHLYLKKGKYQGSVRNWTLTSSVIFTLHIILSRWWAGDVSWRVLSSEIYRRGVRYVPDHLSSLCFMSFQLHLHSFNNFHNILWREKLTKLLDKKFSTASCHFTFKKQNLWVIQPWLPPKQFVEWPQSVVREFTANMFQQCFRQLYQHWQICIVANGNYFEGRCGSA